MTQKHEKTGQECKYYQIGIKLIFQDKNFKYWRKKQELKMVDSRWKPNFCFQLSDIHRIPILLGS